MDEKTKCRFCGMEMEGVLCAYHVPCLENALIDELENRGKPDFELRNIAQGADAFGALPLFSKVHLEMLDDRCKEWAKLNKPIPPEGRTLKEGQNPKPKLQFGEFKKLLYIMLGKRLEDSDECGDDENVLYDEFSSKLESWRQGKREGMASIAKVRFKIRCKECQREYEIGFGEEFRCDDCKCSWFVMLSRDYVEACKAPRL